MMRTDRATKVTRKMCAVWQHHLGKGGPLRAPVCNPPGLWRCSGHRAHSRASQSYRRL